MGLWLGRHGLRDRRRTLFDMPCEPGCFEKSQTNTSSQSECVTTMSSICLTSIIRLHCSSLWDRGIVGSWDSGRARGWQKGATVTLLRTFHGTACMRQSWDMGHTE